MVHPENSPAPEPGPGKYYPPRKKLAHLTDPLIYCRLKNYFAEIASQKFL